MGWGWAHRFLWGSGVRLGRSVCMRVAECGRPHPNARPTHPCAARAGTCGQLLLEVVSRVSRRPGSRAEGFRAADLYQGTRLAKASVPNLTNLVMAVKAYRHGGERGGLAEVGRAHGFLRDFGVRCPVCVHTRRRVWDVSSSRTPSFPVQPELARVGICWRS